MTDLQLTGPSFSRLFDWSLGPFRKWKHVIEPRAEWAYLAGRDDFSQTPLFDEIDSLTQTNALRYSLFQHLLAKGEKGGSREVASFEIARFYYFLLPGEKSPSGPGPVAQRSSPTDFILRVSAAQGLNFDSRVTWDTHFGQVTAASITAILTRRRAHARAFALRQPPGRDPRRGRPRRLRAAPRLGRHARSSRTGSVSTSRRTTTSRRGRCSRAGRC